jgi:hypothetical protein
MLDSIEAALRDAASHLPTPADVAAMMRDATRALEALQGLTRGIFPTLLTRAGLGPSLSSYFARTGHPDVLTLHESAQHRRFSARVEAAAYFCCLRAVGDATDVRKPTRVSISVAADVLGIDVQGAALETIDTAAMLDRVGACAGSLAIDQDVLRVRLPLEADPADTADDQRAATAAAHS